VHLHEFDFQGATSIREIADKAMDGALLTILTTHMTAEQGYLTMLRFKEQIQSHVHLRVILSASRPDFEDIGNAQNIGYSPPSDTLLSKSSLQEIDRIGRCIHEEWLEGNKQRISSARIEGDKKLATELEDKPTNKRWEELSEEQRDINRYAGDHILVKIRSVGLDPESLNLADEWNSLSSEQLETLARMEHQRWCAPLWLANWTLGPRNDQRKYHPNLMAYDGLDEDTKNYDRQQVCKAAQYHLAARVPNLGNKVFVRVREE
jgi:hypothetical protein